VIVTPNSEKNMINEKRDIEWVKERGWELV
jgi:hypothetical protein